MPTVEVQRRLIAITCLVVVWFSSMCLTSLAYGGDPLRNNNVVDGGHSTDLEPTKELISNYCLECHNADQPSAGLNLESLDFAAASNPTVDWDCAPWEKILKRLRTRQMPPRDAVKPGEEEYEQAINGLTESLGVAAETYPRPGRTEPLRRMTRSEYRNAIRDLLALNVEVDQFLPQDQSGHGFDNVTVSELSPMLLDRYITAAQHISRVAVGGDLRGPEGANIRLPADQSQESHVAGLPFGTRGGTLFEHMFVQDGEYEVQVRLARDRDEHVEGLHREHAIHILLDRQLVHEFSVKPPQGDDYTQMDHTLIDAHLKTRVQVSAGPHMVGVTFPQQSAALMETKRQPFDARFNRHRHPRRTPAIFEVSITGPFSPTGAGETPSRQRIFTARPTGKEDQRSCGEEILSKLMRRAYRRPVTAADLRVPMQFFQQGLVDGGFETGIQAGLAAILVSPSFLFRLEKDPVDAVDTSAYQITDLELASRLSFFLWSSLPDDRLLDLAEENQLREPQVLEEQVRRMLQDERSKSLANNFADQWLHLRNLNSSTPDMRKFPDFDDNLRQSFRRETQLVFENILQEDRSVLELLRADYSYLNERLAKHYGIPGVFGSHFRKVPLGPDSHRGGLLRHGSILTVTSYANRTSPTVRGYWVLKNILGTPPPPTPPECSCSQGKINFSQPHRSRAAR